MKSPRNSGNGTLHRLSYWTHLLNEQIRDRRQARQPEHPVSLAELKEQARLGDIVIETVHYKNIHDSEYRGFVFCKSPLFLYPHSGNTAGVYVSRRTADTTYRLVPVVWWMRAIVYLSALRWMWSGQWIK